MSEQHFNKLEPDEAERLAILIEEMSEVQHIACKILRHGYESTNPDGDSTTNRGLLEKEIGDVRHIIQMMVLGEDLRELYINDAQIRRHDTLTKYLHH